MNKPKFIGITGGIGSGKTTVTNIFKMLGVPVYYADDRAKHLMINDKLLKSQIIEAFGPSSYDGNQLNKVHLAKAFKDQKATETLNQLVHPRVGEDFLNWAGKHPTAPYVLKEAALVFEAKGNNKSLDKVITVYTPIEERVKRVLKRDPHRNSKDIEAIISKQMPEDEKISLADYVIYNDGSQSVIEQVMAIDSDLKN